MGKTLRVIRDRRDDPSVTVMAQEALRPKVSVKGEPGATALKLLLVMHDHAGVSVAKDMEHRMDPETLYGVEGLRRMSRHQIKDVLDQVASLRVHFDEGPGGRLGVGALVEGAWLDDAPSGDWTIRYRFGSVFRAVVGESDRWSLIDRPVLLALRSRYAIALLQHLCSVSWRDYRSQALTVPDLRAILGVADNRLKAFRDFRIGALDPAVREVSRLSRFDVTYEAKKRGRGGRVYEVVLQWDLKQQPGQPELQLDARPRSRPRFPSDGEIRWDEYWGPLAREHGQGRDVDQLGREFVAWCASRPTPLPLDAATLARTFAGWARRQHPA